MQDDMPEEGVSVPDGHSVHAVNPEVAANVPEEQEKQADMPDADVNEPATH